MKLILLVGKPGKGKTTTLNLLYDTMCPKPTEIISGKAQIGGCKRDFECILEWNGKATPLKVGIYTMGDFYHGCISAAQKYSQKVDVLVLAYSDKFVSGYQQILAPYPSHYVVNKTVAPNRSAENQCNQQDVNSILAAL